MISKNNIAVQILKIATNDGSYFNPTLPVSILKFEIIPTDKYPNLRGRVPFCSGRDTFSFEWDTFSVRRDTFSFCMDTFSGKREPSSSGRERFSVGRDTYQDSFYINRWSLSCSCQIIR
jgi:hypothetical protein